MKLFKKILIGMRHAKYHRYLRKAIHAKDNSDIKKFKKYIYRAEDAWRQMVILIEKQKK